MKITVLPVTLFVSFLSISLCNPIDSESDHPKRETPWMWNLQDYPNPLLNPEKCGQKEPSTLCDPNSILNENEATALGDLMSRLHNTSPCLCKEACAEEAHNRGLIVGVALLRSIPYSMDQNINEKTFSLNKELRKNWNLGSCGNDILFMVNTEQNSGSYVAGDAVKEIIKEETIDAIFADCKSHFNTGHHYQGLESIVNSLYDELQKIQKAPGMSNDGDTSQSNVGLTVGIIVGLACLCGLAAAGFLYIRRRKQNNNRNGFMYDRGSRNSSNKREVISPIVKQHVVFPDAIYQPCSVEDSKKPMQTDNQPPSDEEEEVENSDEFYLKTLEENPAYESADMFRSSRGLGSAENSPSVPPVAVHHSNKSNGDNNMNVGV